MDCPSCGLANPPEALKCDCGYDFSAGRPADFPGWEISLAWRQKVAAFWSISWPAWIGSMGLIILFMNGFSVDPLQDNFSTIALGGNLVFFPIQALLTRRLVRKNYRSFRSKSRNLSIREAVSVWLWTLGTQLALLLLVSLPVWFRGTKFPPDTVRGFSSISLWLWFLVVGPYAVGLALRAKYPAFRLQAHGFRHI